VRALLRVLGRGGARDWSRYHQLLNRASWSAWRLSRPLLQQALKHLAPAEASLLLVMDEPLERRTGEQISLRSWRRAAVRSVGKPVSVTLGIRWLVVALLAPVPWSAPLVGAAGADPAAAQSRAATS
jgi:hypothetical protein